MVHLKGNASSVWDLVQHKCAIAYEMHRARSLLVFDIHRPHESLGHQSVEKALVLHVAFADFERGVAIEVRIDGGVFHIRSPPANIEITAWLRFR